MKEELYIPLNRSTMAQKLSASLTECPIAENVSERLIRLPFFTTLTDGELETVIEVARGFDVNR